MRRRVGGREGVGGRRMEWGSGGGGVKSERYSNNDSIVDRGVNKQQASQKGGKVLAAGFAIFRDGSVSLGRLLYCTTCDCDKVCLHLLCSSPFSFPPPPPPPPPPPVILSAMLSARKPTTTLDCMWDLMRSRSIELESYPLAHPFRDSCICASSHAS